MQDVWLLNIFFGTSNWSRGGAGVDREKEQEPGYIISEVENAICLRQANIHVLKEGGAMGDGEKECVWRYCWNGNSKI